MTSGVSNKYLLLPAYILAGGRSSRFGADKARVLLGGRPMIARLADMIAGEVRALFAVARDADEYRHLGLVTIGDIEHDLGPIGGLRTALEHARSCGCGWIFVISCDFAFFRPEWLHALLDRVTDDAQAVVFRGQHIEPLFGLYATAALPLVIETIRGGDLAMHRLLSRLRTAYLSLPADWPDLAHVNTPEELDRLRGSQIRTDARLPQP